MSKKISQKKIDANRRNAKKSTGPKTKEGKAKSAMNSIKYGIIQINILLKMKALWNFKIIEKKCSNV